MARLSTGDKIALISLMVGLLGTIGTWLTVPEFRQWLRLQVRSRPTPVAPKPSARPMPPPLRLPPYTIRLERCTLARAEVRCRMTVSHNSSEVRTPYIYIHELWKPLSTLVDGEGQTRVATHCIFDQDNGRWFVGAKLKPNLNYKLEVAFGPVEGQVSSAQAFDLLMYDYRLRDDAAAASDPNHRPYVVSAADIPPTSVARDAPGFRLIRFTNVPITSDRPD